jgi:hypothetical protein
MKSAFEHFINVRQNKPAELLARFVDKKMRGEKGVGEAEVDAQLEKVTEKKEGKIISLFFCYESYYFNFLSLY